MRVVWTHAAHLDLVEIRRYIATEDPGAAARVAARLLEAVEHLQGNPHLGRPGRLPGTRELVVAKTPYVIPYRVREDTVDLLRVLHGRRQWPEKL